VVKSEWRILVVEDDLDGQALMTTLLGHLDIPVDVANDVAEAEQFLFESGTDYQAVIIDLALPDKDGWQLLAEIQANPRTEALSCLAVTAFHTSKLREDAILAGFKAYFPKPIDSTSFLRELETIV
jgi:two-component system, chemotaxis family, CheB/CheR fusion protein